MINELRAIAIFAETVKQGSFRGAAKSLDLSPSVVSHHVAALEKKVGNALIYRSTRKLSLTHEGERLFRHAVQMLDHAQAGLSEVTPSSTGPSGKLSVALPSVLSRSHYSRRIAQFASRYPALELNLHSSDERQNIIEQGIDVAIRAGKLSDSSLKSKPIGFISRKLVCSKQYYSQQNPPRHPSDLEGWTWVKTAMLSNIRVLTGPGGERVEVTASGAISVNNIDFATEFCKSGLGLATPPDFLIQGELARGELVEVLPDWTVEPVPLTAVWPDNVSANSNVRFLLKELLER